MFNKSDRELWFNNISSDKPSFNFEEFEKVYHNKPMLLSWIDYFRNNDHEILVFINANIKSLMDLLENFFSNFFVIMNKVQIKGNTETNVFEPAINEINKFCKLIEISRKNFMSSESMFNIRTIFDNLKKTNLINTISK